MYLLYVPTRAGYDTGSVFKLSTTGLNSEVFLFLDRLLYQV